MKSNDEMLIRLYQPYWSSPGDRFFIYEGYAYMRDKDGRWYTVSNIRSPHSVCPAASPRARRMDKLYREELTFLRPKQRQKRLRERARRLKHGPRDLWALVDFNGGPSEVVEIGLSIPRRKKSTVDELEKKILRHFRFARNYGMTADRLRTVLKRTLKEEDMAFTDSNRGAGRIPHCVDCKHYRSPQHECMRLVPKQETCPVTGKQRDIITNLDCFIERKVIDVASCGPSGQFFEEK